MEKVRANKLISLVISVYNEEKNINPLYNQLSKVLNGIGVDYEIIFVNDGSKDYSLMKMIDLLELDQNIKIVNFSRNFGHEIAMTAGMDYAKGDAIIFMDSDLQHPPELVKTMVDKWLSGIDLVITKRVNNEDDSLIKKIISRCYYKILNVLSEVEIASGFSDFRLIDRKYIDRIKQIAERDRLFRGILNWVGINNYCTLEFVAPKRIHGVSKYNLIKYANLGINAILQFSIKPLRVITLFGFCAAITSMLYASYVVIDHLVFKRPETGFSTIVTLMVILFSIQTTIIGVIGEYVGRIHLEIKKRPLYFAELIDSNKSNTSPQAMRNETLGNSNQKPQ